MRTASVITLTAAGVVAWICALPAVAEDQEPDLLPDTEAFRFNTQDKFYSKRKYSDDFRMKGIEIRRNVYFGEAKIAGEKGPGIVVERGNLTWGFNHQAAEIQLRF
jgi:hypothetical protein